MTALKNQVESLNEEIAKLQEKVSQLETDLAVKKSTVDDMTEQMKKEQSTCKEALEGVTLSLLLTFMYSCICYIRYLYI